MGSDFTEGASWIEAEIDDTGFGDAFLAERLRKLMGQLDGAFGQPIPLACEDWANTKAAYRFLANASVNEGPILAGHFHATARRAGGTDVLILVLQDTTECCLSTGEPGDHRLYRMSTVGEIKTDAGASTSCAAC